MESAAESVSQLSEESCQSGLQPPNYLPEEPLERQSSTNLISPDSRNNNRSFVDQDANKSVLVKQDDGDRTNIGADKSDKGSCINEDKDGNVIVDESCAKDCTDYAQSFDGKILFSKDGAAYIIEGNDNDSCLPVDQTALSTEQAFSGDSSVIQAFHVSTTCGSPSVPVIQQYDVLRETGKKRASLPDKQVAKDSSHRLLICFMCKLSFSQSQSFVSHATKEHAHEFKQDDMALLEGGISAIIQKGPLVTLLTPAAEQCSQESTAEVSSSDNRVPQTSADMTAEEVARNLMLASELSATRLLQQVSQNAMAMATVPTPAVSVPSAPCAMQLPAGCASHPEGKPPALECSKCDLLQISKQQNFGHMAFLHSAAASRNSCKTLKCPKCNWHYKYQETLEIHMKEKHPDAEVSCSYCLHNQPHPKLARGETYGCGYKPYRCEICKYSTTTKGNLSIHMQSDKHLNNVQELQQGGSVVDPSALIHSQQPAAAAPRTPTSSSTPDSARSLAGEKLRCDLCNYETTVPRNLRIHMTCEKHTQNALLLQRKLGGFVQETPIGFPGGANGSEHALMELAAGDFLQMSDQLPKMLQCCVCNVFACDSLDELLLHVSADRSQPAASDVSMVAGNYFCNLCQYKTHLKANFQLHTKTDKHLQRLNLVNHVREGGLENDWRLRYVNVNSPVQLRCNACNEFFTSKDKLQVHTLTLRHHTFRSALQKLNTVETSDSARQEFACGLCEYSTTKPIELLNHLHSASHGSSLSQLLGAANGSQTSPDLVQLRLNTSGEDGKQDINEDASWDIFEGETDQMTDAIHCCAYCNYTCKLSQELREHVSMQHSAEEEPIIETSANSGSKIEASLTKEELSCPLCSMKCNRREELETHLSKTHNITEENVERLLSVLPVDVTRGSISGQSGSPPASVAADSTTASGGDSEKDGSVSPHTGTASQPLHCPVCALPFSSSEQLSMHQSDSGHVELKQTPAGPGYLCLQRGCNQYFKTVANVLVHFREIHARKPQPAQSCVSDRHVYRFRCTQCSLAYRTEEKLQAHSIYHMMRASTRCQLCARSFRSVSSLRKHVESTHVGEGVHTHDTDSAGSPSPDGDTADAADDDPAMSTNSDDDLLNSAAMVENGYKDPNRHYKCHRCKMGFTKQQYLIAHNKTGLHRKGDKIHYSLEKYRDPTRPFKCDVCRESFTQKNILLVHFNSVSHMNKAKKLLEQQSQISPDILEAINKGQMHSLSLQTAVSSAKADAIKPIVKSNTQTPASPSISSKPYRCNICKVGYNQGSTLDIHLRSVGHQTRAAKVEELFKKGEVDPNKPLIEQPDFGTSSITKQSTDNLLTSKTKNAAATQDQQSQQEQLQQLALMSSMMNMAQMAPFLAQAFQQNPFAMAPSLAATHPAKYSCRQCSAAFPTEDTLKFHELTLCPATINSQSQAAAALIGLSNGTADHSPPTGDKAEDNEKPSTVLQQKLINNSLQKGGAAFKRMLENFGFDEVMQYNENVIQRKRKAEDAVADEKLVAETANEIGAKKIKVEECEDEAKANTTESAAPVHKQNIPDVKRCECQECGKSFSSIWVLKSHMEQIHHDAIPLKVIDKISEKLKEAIEKKKIEEKSDEAEKPIKTEEASPTPPPIATSATPKTETSVASTPVAQASPQKTPVKASVLTAVPSISQNNSAAALSAAAAAQNPFLSGLPFMGNFHSPFAGAFSNPFMSMLLPPALSGFAMPPVSDANMSINDMIKAGNPFNVQVSSASSSTSSAAVMQPTASAYATAQQNNPNKRARTRITDDQLKILREYFDINNSPSDQQIEEMSNKSQLPQKVIKHWFRNTLFKERQRNKDSPYNFSIPPSLGIDLEEYEKSGEAKIIKLSKEDNEDTKDIGEPSKLVIVEEERANNSEDKPAQTVNAQPQKTTTVSESAQLQHVEEQEVSAQETLRRLTAMPALSGFPMSAASAFSMLGGQQPPTDADARSVASMSPAASGSESMTSLIASAMTPAGLVGAPGRRANRTRFSDFQLRTLQEFFEKQAYPKDDDLECLSKQLNLSPRVIVVWFQNARQKARKVYENQPHVDGAERYMRTPGCNFQCKRCSLVFQRYYELIQHQQKECYKDESIPDFERDAASKSPRAPPRVLSASAAVPEFNCDSCKISFAGSSQLEEHLSVHASNPLLFTDKASSKTVQQQINSGMGGSGTPERDTSPAHSLLARSRKQPGSNGVTSADFNKRCPFCAILFHKKDSMENHLKLRHADQCIKTTVNIDCLPDAEEVPTFTPRMLNGSGTLAQSMLSLGMLAGGNGNAGGESSQIDVLKKITEGVGESGGAASPLDLSRAPVSDGSTGEEQHGGSSSVSPNMSVEHSDNEDSRSTFGVGSPSPALYGQCMSGVGGRPPSKRFRTHLSPMQIQLMKRLFHDYKTPSMSECELLGGVIGLHKRVVQVWFQNARAKERKVKVANGEDARLDSTSLQSNSALRCNACDVVYTPKNSLQDHIFTREHIGRLREELRAAGTDDSLQSTVSQTFPPPPIPTATTTTTVAANNSPAALPSPQRSHGIVSKAKAPASTAQSQSPAAQSKKTTQNAANVADASAAVAQNLLPYMNPAAYAYAANMMNYGAAGFGGLAMGGFMCDPTLMGTPITLLQIPPTVMEMISRDLNDSTKKSSQFTQDGADFDQFLGSLSDNDARCAAQKHVEVGWACRKCSMVFQSEALYNNHKSVMCQSSDPVFTLVQTHYHCNTCNNKFGTQAEFKTHCDSAEHKARNV